MERKEYEMPDEYKQNLAHSAEFIETREGYRKQIRDGLAAGVRVSAADKAMVDEKLREFDVLIDGLERDLAAEYERYQAEMAKEAELAEGIAKAMVLAKHIYIIIKHQKPTRFESFTEAAFGPLLPEEREEFLDDVAILETTQLDAILNGEV
ncbi:MAG: hypothetical protein IPK98_15440 [Chloracidobacterium sp.]|nr:hypothetical protein [Chloracidobacterium sp.]